MLRSIQAEGVGVSRRAAAEGKTLLHGDINQSNLLIDLEVSFSNNAVGIRDSHHPHGAVLVFGHAEWTIFLDGISDGAAR